MAAQVLTLTDAAAARVKALIARSDKPVEGLRVGIKTRGCSGMSYVVEYAEDKKPFEDVVEDKGVRIFVDPSALMFLIGSEMDYREDKMQSGFVFNNPNETARCGCGESFSVG
ncbi:iron-sulfur cluster assembly accessory protein [Caenispirillum bisanense]|uniref:HesB/IscA family protein n=1 Tax=Caenispirillum bisanense TaxID=414052 RepID=UPI0031DEA6CF